MLIKRDLSYGSDERHRFDVYIPEKANGASIVCIHGGGWWQGDKQKEKRVPEALVGSGYLVFVPNYRLAQGVDKEGVPLDVAEQKNLFPTQINDLLLFIDYIHQSEQWVIGNLGIFGSSSGGNIATELAARKGFPTVSWSGLVDFEGFYNKNGETPMIKREHLENTPSEKIDQGGSDDPYYKWCLMNLVGGDTSRLTEASVIHRISAKTGPMYLAVSEDELVHSYEVENLTNALIENGVEVQSQYLKGSRHAEAYFDDAIRPSIEFFKHYLLDA